MKNLCSLLLIGTILFLSGSVSFADVQRHEQRSTTIEQSVLHSSNAVVFLMKYDAILANTFDDSRPAVSTIYSTVTLNSKRMIDALALTGYSYRFY